MDDSLLHINMNDDNTFGMDLKSDTLEIDIKSMIETDTLNVSLTDGDILQTNLESTERFDIQLKEGIPIGMDDYEALRNLPSVNDVTLIGNKTFEDLGRDKITNSDIKSIIDEQYELIFGGGNNG